MSKLKALVNQDVARSEDEAVWTGLKASKRGEICVIDFFIQMVLEENAYQIRAGTITAPVPGDVDITDASAEMAVAALIGTTVMPCEVWVAVGENQEGDSIQIAAKSVATATMSGGTAFEPLNLFIGGKTAITKGMTGTAGGVTVTAELDTTTRQHFQVTQEFSNDSGAERLQRSWPYPQGKDKSFAGSGCDPIIWHPQILPFLVGPSCFYVQAGADTTTMDYFAHIDYIELPTTSVT